MSDLLAVVVPLALLVLFIVVVIVACRQVFARNLPDDERVLVRGDLKQGLLMGAGLATAQLAFLSVVYGVGGSAAASLGLTDLVVALMFPVLWAGGKREERMLGLPIRMHWDRRQRLITTANIWLVGVVTTIALFLAVKVEAGYAVKGLQQSEDQLAVGLMGFWMILNAPWMEELLFRHALMPQVARRLGGGRRNLWVSALLVSCMFAVGHAGNMEPIWAKFVQTFTWGLGLAWVRMNLGTPWAILLHLAWNFASIGIAFLVMPEAMAG